MIDRRFPKVTGEARFPLRKSGLALTMFAAGALLLCLMFVHAAASRKNDAVHLDRLTMVVKNLELTDLCLFTEARYTRHLSQADLHSAFQDHPVALEHFPTGSIAGPPAGLRRLHGQLD